MGSNVIRKYIKDLLHLIFPNLNQRLFHIIKTINGYFDNNHDEIYLIHRLFRKIIKTGVMVDVGAHYGGSLRPFALDNWLIYAFEPDNNNRKELTKSFSSFNNVIIDNRAISNENKVNQPFYSSEISTGISGLSKFHSSHQEKMKVDTITLMNFCKDRKIEHIDFLKIDTEGFDLFVLKSLPWMKIRPNIILCEFENNKTELLGYNSYDMAEYLVQKGYRIIISEWYPIKEYGKKHQWRKFIEYPGKLTDNNSFGNFIATRDDEIFIKLKKVTLG